MGYLNVTNITFEEGTSSVKKPFNLTIQFECLKNQTEEVEWKFIYVGDSHDIIHDQVLDVIVMDSVDYGCNEFTWEVDQPNYSLVPNQQEILDSTIVMIEASYKEKLFFRCSYLIRHFYTDPELQENTPDTVLFDKLHREILIGNPIVTIYELAWKDQEGGLGGLSSNQIIDSSVFKDVNMFEEESNDKLGERRNLLEELERKNEINDTPAVA